MLCHLVLEIPTYRSLSFNGNGNSKVKCQLPIEKCVNRSVWNWIAWHLLKRWRGIDAMQLISNESYFVILLIKKMHDPIVSALFHRLKNNKSFQWMDFGINSVRICRNGAIFKQLLPTKVHTRKIFCQTKGEMNKKERERNWYRLRKKWNIMDHIM